MNDNYKIKFSRKEYYIIEFKVQDENNQWHYHQDITCDCTPKDKNDVKHTIMIAGITAPCYCYMCRCPNMRYFDPDENILHTTCGENCTKLCIEF